MDPLAALFGVFVALAAGYGLLGLHYGMGPSYSRLRLVITLSAILAIAAVVVAYGAFEPQVTARVLIKHHE